MLADRVRMGTIKEINMIKVYVHGHMYYLPDQTLNFIPFIKPLLNPNYEFEITTAEINAIISEYGGSPVVYGGASQEDPLEIETALSRYILLDVSNYPYVISDIVSVDGVAASKLTVGFTPIRVYKLNTALQEGSVVLINIYYD